MPREHELIEKYFAPLVINAPGALGLRDDAALMQPPPGQELVITKDLLAEGVHFLPGDPPESLAHKLLAVNFSDLAAMGAQPMAVLLGLGLTAQQDEAWLQAFSGALGEGLVRAQAQLLGGDTISSPQVLVLSLTAIGVVPTGQALRRATAQAGDLIVLSGEVGLAAIGLARLQHLEPQNAADDRFIRAYRYPEARVTLGAHLRGFASACTDVSDGVLADANRIAIASILGFEIELSEIPHPSELKALAAATAGDDYELLFTLPPNRAAELLTLSKDLGVKLSVIGRMTRELGARVRVSGGAWFTPERLGFQHQT